MVVGEKLGAKSTPSTELLSPSSTVSRSTVSNWSYSARAKTSLAPGSMPKKTSAVRPFFLNSASRAISSSTSAVPTMSRGPAAAMSR